MQGEIIDITGTGLTPERLATVERSAGVAVVTLNRPKMLIGRGQNGTAAGTGGPPPPVMGIPRCRRTERA